MPVVPDVLFMEGLTVRAGGARNAIGDGGTVAGAHDLMLLDGDDDRACFTEFHPCQGLGDIGLHGR